MHHAYFHAFQDVRDLAGEQEFPWSTETNDGTDMGPWDTMDTQVLDEEAKEGIAYDAPSADGAGGCGDEHSPVEKSCFFFFAEPQWKLPTNLMIDIDIHWSSFWPTSQ